MKAGCQFDSVEKVLHNLVSLLLKQNAKAKCPESRKQYRIRSTLFFKNLTTDKCGRLE